MTQEDMNRLQEIDNEIDALVAKQNYIGYQERR